MPDVRDDLARERAREAWRLRMQGWTQQRIADHMGMDQSTISDSLRRIEAQLAQEFVADAHLIKARQTELLEVVVDEAMQQWRRSCEDAETRVEVTGKIKGGGDKGDKDRAQITRTYEGQTGNPALLSQARGALADIRTIWGLDAAKKQEWSGPDGGPIQQQVIGQVNIKDARQRPDDL